MNLRLPILFQAVFGLVNACEKPAATSETTRPNILFIAIDDLRPQLGAYGETYMHTPKP